MSLFCIDTENIESCIENSNLCIVLLSESFCKPCQEFRKEIDKNFDFVGQHFNFVERERFVNASQNCLVKCSFLGNKALAEKHDVTKIPTALFFRKGAYTDRATNYKDMCEKICELEKPEIKLIF